MEIKKKKRVLLMSDWLKIWMAASSLDVNGNKAIKKKIVFLANRLVFPNTVTYTVDVTVSTEKPCAQISTGRFSLQF